MPDAVTCLPDQIAKLAKSSLGCGEITVEFPWIAEHQ